MRYLCAALVLSAALLAAGNANAAEEEASVTALLKQGYSIVGILPSTAGPGIFLKKGDVLIACFVAETSSSKDIATKYCKPVR